MTHTFQPDTRPRPPDSRELGIGLIGCGGIVENGHLPAYRQAGFHVAAIASRTAGHVQPCAAKWGIAKVFTDWRQLLELNEVQIVDVTYPFDEERLEIVAAAAAAGKHILMQKPLAHSRLAAQEMVRLARAAKVRLAVNQNARWCPVYRATRLAVEEGLLGQPYFAIHEMQSSQDSQGWWQKGWYARGERFQLIEYSVHHLDLLRWWWGAEPVSVKATLARKPGQCARGEMIVSVQMGMPDGGLAVMVDDNASHPQAPMQSRFRVEGTTGVVGGEMMSGAFAGRSDLLTPGEQRPALEGTWFPGAFAGTMGELMQAVLEGREPSISGEDNLKTLEIVFRAYEAAGVG